MLPKIQQINNFTFVKLTKQKTKGKSSQVDDTATKIKEEMIRKDNTDQSLPLTQM